MIEILIKKVETLDNEIKAFQDLQEKYFREFGRKLNKE